MSQVTFESLAANMRRRGENIQLNTNRLVRKTFVHVAENVIRHNPLWSGQSKLNWTASMSAARPSARFVNVPRSNARVRKGSAGHAKFSGGKEGNRSSIAVDSAVASTAEAVAISAVHEVARRYDTYKPTGRKRMPTLRISNSLKYVGELWSGRWPSNPRTLATEIRSGVEFLRSTNTKLLTK